MGADFLTSAPGIQFAVIPLSQDLVEPSFEICIYVCRPTLCACSPESAFIDFLLRRVVVQTCGNCHFFKLQTGFELRDFVRHDVLVGKAKQLDDGNP